MGVNNTRHKPLHRNDLRQFGRRRFYRRKPFDINDLRRPFQILNVQRVAKCLPCIDLPLGGLTVLL